MKWTLLLPIACLLAGCGITNTQVIEYREITVGTPVIYSDTILDNTNTMDVTTTVIEKY